MPAGLFLGVKACEADAEQCWGDRKRASSLSPPPTPPPPSARGLQSWSAPLSARRCF